MPIPIRRIASELKQKGRPFDPPTIIFWREQLKDSDPVRRYQGIWILGWIGDYDSFPNLISCAQREREPKNMKLLLETLPSLYLLRNLPE